MMTPYYEDPIETIDDVIASGRKLYIQAYYARRIEVEYVFPYFLI